MKIISTAVRIIPLFLLAIAPMPCRSEMGLMPRKLIATGWDEAEPGRLRENLAEMEKRPFDGVVIEVEGKREDGKPCRVRAAFANEKWQRAWFDEEVKTLKQCRFRRFTDNFITIGANPGNVDWFDDAGWREIADHWRIAARLVREAGFRGLLFDPEPYTKPWAAFSYGAQPQRDQHSFDDYCVQARRRGREVMAALAAEDPDAVVFSYFLNSVVAPAAGHADPRRALATMGYGLLPAFLDGWLDAAPPAMTFVDGCESAYRYNSVEEFLEAAVRIKGACQALVAPENRAKYRAQVQVSFGIYLDAYWNPPGSPWFVDGKGGPRVERLGANVATALRVADEYVWLYGEKYRWWPTPNKSVRAQTWDEALPGCERELGLARNPVEWARNEIAERKKSAAAGLTSEGNAGSATSRPLVNLARNGDFESEKVTLGDGKVETWKEGRPPAGWNAWQEESSKGRFTWDREAGRRGDAGERDVETRRRGDTETKRNGGAARAEGVANGCFVQRCDVRPGEVYAVRAVRRLEGRGEASIRVRWQTADEKWTAEGRDVAIFAEGPRGEWGEMFGVAEVPPGAGKLAVLLGVRDQRGEGDVAWFDEVEVCRIK